MQCLAPDASFPSRLNSPAHGARQADPRIKRGDLVMLEAMGGGVTWDATLFRW